MGHHHPSGPPKYTDQPEGLPRDYGHLHVQAVDDGRGPLPRRDLLALLLLLVLAFAGFGTYLLHPFDLALPRASEPYDAAIYPWNAFWVGEALGAPDGSLVFTRRFFHPDGEGLALYTPTYVTSGLALAFSWIFGEARGPFVAGASFFFLSSAATCILAFLLARRLSLGTAGALVVAVIVGFAAGRLMNVPRQNLFCTEFLLLPLVFLERWVRSGSVRAALGLGVASAALLLQSQPLFLLGFLAGLGLLLAGVVFLPLRSRNAAPWWTLARARSAGIAVLVFGVLAAPFLVEMVSELGNGGPALEQHDRWILFPDNSLDAAALVTPTPFDRGYGAALGVRRPSFFEGVVPGSSVSFFFGFAAWALVALSLLGPARRTVVATAIATAVALGFALGPVVYVLGEAALPGPYRLLHHLPPLRVDKSPVRAVLLVEMGLAVLAGLGMDKLHAFLRPRSRAAALGALGLALAALLYERSETLPSSSIEPRLRIPADLASTLAPAGEGAVLDLPYDDPSIGGNHRVHSLSQALGAVHQRPIFGGLYPRATRRNFARVESTAWLAGLRTIFAAVAGSTDPDAPVELPPLDAPALREELATLDVAWIFVHRVADDPPDRRRYSRAIAEWLSPLATGEIQDLVLAEHWRVTAIPVGTR